MNIGTWLERRAAQTPDRDALFAGRDCVASYAQLDRSARALASWIRDNGVQSGDRVAVFMDNVPDYIRIFYAVWYAGAVLVPINAKLHEAEASWIIENSQASLTFASGTKAKALLRINAKTRVVNVDEQEFKDALASNATFDCTARCPDDLAWLFYTSGTTGQPKGVMISHRMLTTVSLSYFADVDHVKGEDAALYAAPMSHGAGLYNMIHVLKGARHVFPPSSGFEPTEIFELAKHFDNVHMFAAPTMVKRLTRVAKELGIKGQGLRSVIYAGGPMYVTDIIEAVDHFGDIFIQIYGQGECPMGITALSRHDVSDRSHNNWRARLGSVGVAQSSVDVRIANEHGKTLECGETGEIMVRGDAVMKGYWQNEEATRKALLDGWLMTGDMGFVDSDGYVTLVDRSKDMIISGGSNIYPREVEEVLLTHPSVSDVSVVGQMHAEWGEIVIAFIVPAISGQMDETALDKHCLAHIARFKRPKRYVEIETLPKNNYGKVLKTDLRKRLAER